MDIADASSVGLEDASAGLQPTQKHFCGLEIDRPDRDFKHRGTPMHFQDNRFPFLPTERPDRLKFRSVSRSDFVSSMQARLLRRRSVYDAGDCVATSRLGTRNDTDARVRDAAVRKRTL